MIAVKIKLSVISHLHCNDFPQDKVADCHQKTYPSYRQPSNSRSGPMHEELTTLLREHRLGVPLPEAFERMSNRMPCEDMHLLATSIALSSKSGGSLTDVLEEMVGLIRERTEFQGRLKNMTAQGKFEAAVISCAPLAAFILLYLIDPVLMRPLVTTE